MIPNQECRHVGKRKGPEFLTQLYPEMGGQVRPFVGSWNNKHKNFY